MNANRDCLMCQVENDLRQMEEATRAERVRRHLEVRPHPIVANHHFSAASTECINLYRDGHFYGCIALVQAVAEALVKFLCMRNGWDAGKSFEKNTDALLRRGFISQEMKERLSGIWAKRNDYHHLNSTVEMERKKLEAIAKGKLGLLREVEAEVFAFTIVGDLISPAHPKYWDIAGGQADVYLRCE